MVGPRCVKEGLISQKICTEMRLIPLIPLIPSIPVAAVNLVQLILLVVNNGERNRDTNKVSQKF